MFTISYNANGGMGSTVDTVQSGIIYTVKSPTDADIAYYSGYTFAGWNAVPDGSEAPYVPGDNFTVTASMTLYAQWQALPDVPVTYDANRGTGSAIDNVQPYTVYTVKSPVQTRITYLGHTLTSWNTAPDGSGSSYIPGYDYTVTADMTLYAIWQPMPALSVYYYANGGAGVALNFVLPGLKYSVLSEVQTGSEYFGFNFTGWNTAPDGSGNNYAPGYEYKITADLTLYARWQPLPIITVKYNPGAFASGGSTDQGYLSYEYTIKTVGEASVDPEYNIFDAWNTAADGTGSTFHPGDTILLEYNITLTAIWKGD